MKEITHIGWIVLAICLVATHFGCEGERTITRALRGVVRYKTTADEGYIAIAPADGTAVRVVRLDRSTYAAYRIGDTITLALERDTMFQRDP